jgi:hypothetical protein
MGLTLGGCSKSPVKLNPVRGQVFFKNQPAEGAQIVFRQAGDESSKAPTPYGTVGADGRFTLRTEPYGAGAPAGDYVVLISWYGPNPRDPLDAVSKLPAKYADPAKPLMKATVKEGQNELEPFKLSP